MTEIGIAHSGGQYTPNPPGSPILGVSLQGGVTAIKGIGTNGPGVLKLWFTPDYFNKYPNTTFTGTATTLAQLAAEPEYATVFADPQFHTHTLVTFSFANGENNPWQFKFTTAQLEAEKQEFRELTEYLITTYQGQNKTFILQNWEGDWGLLNAFDESVEVPYRRPEHMSSWFRARQQGIEEGRRALGQRGVRVIHALELNRVREIIRGNLRSKRRLLYDILPKTGVDMISFSAWDTITEGLGANTADSVAIIEDRLPKAIQLFREAAPGIPIYFGEYGWAENELPITIDFTTLFNTVQTIANAEDILYNIYWQIYDNECGGPAPGDACRGIWVIKPDGTLSGAGLALSANL